MIFPQYDVAIIIRRSIRFNFNKGNADTDAQFVGFNTICFLRIDELVLAKTKSADFLLARRIMNEWYG